MIMMLGSEAEARIEQLNEMLKSLGEFKKVLLEIMSKEFTCSHRYYKRLEVVVKKQIARVGGEMFSNLKALGKHIKVKLLDLQSLLCRGDPGTGFSGSQGTLFPGVSLQTTLRNCGLRYCIESNESS